MTAVEPLTSAATRFVTAKLVRGADVLWNACALTLATRERRWPRSLAVAGLAGCALLALSLPVVSVAGGTLLLARVRRCTRCGADSVVEPGTRSASRQGYE